MRITDQFDCFLFDWDGCLADTLGLWFSAYREIFTKYGLTATDEQIINQFGTLGKGPAQLGAINGDQIFDEVQGLVASKISNVNLNPNALEMLQRLKGLNKKLAILTSSTRNSVEPAIKSREIVVDLLLAKEDVTNRKPDPEIVYKSLEKLGCSKDKTVIIGDSDKDILAGKAAGISTVIYYPEVNHKYYQESDLRKLSPDFFIADFKELMKLSRAKSPRFLFGKYITYRL